MEPLRFGRQTFRSSLARERRKGGRCRWSSVFGEEIGYSAGSGRPGEWRPSEKLQVPWTGEEEKLHLGEGSFE